MNKLKIQNVAELKLHSQVFEWPLAEGEVFCVSRRGHAEAWMGSKEFDVAPIQGDLMRNGAYTKPQYVTQPYKSKKKTFEKWQSYLIEQFRYNTGTYKRK